MVGNQCFIFLVSSVLEIYLKTHKNLNRATGWYLGKGTRISLL